VEQTARLDLRGTQSLGNAGFGLDQTAESTGNLDHSTPGIGAVATNCDNVVPARRSCHEGMLNGSS
jgi:hypothetical protein